MPQRAERSRVPGRAPQPGDGPLPPATRAQRRRLGQVVLVLTLLTVALCAGAAPAEVRMPFVLATASLLPGYGLAVRFDVDLATLIAIDLCLSLAIEGAVAFLMVQSTLWHPTAAALVVGAVGGGHALLTVTGLTERA